MTNSPEIEPGVRLKVHPGLCVGWGNCQRFGPEVYTLDDEGRVDFQLLDVPAGLAYEAVGGGAACPNQAITVIGKQYDYWYARRYGRRPLEAPHQAPEGRTTTSSEDHRP